MAKIRNYGEADFDAVYRICLETGAAGKDATSLYEDSRIIGHVYAGPYVRFSPETAFVIEDEDGVGAYIIGPVDTKSFEKRLEQDWWPELRRKYSDPDIAHAADWSADERMMHLIHHPAKTPKRIAERHPAHLHIDLLPRLQGRGLGRELIRLWSERVRALGATGFHLAVGAANERAIGFYRACGLEEVESHGPPYNVFFFGQRL